MPRISHATLTHGEAQEVADALEQGDDLANTQIVSVLINLLRRINYLEQQLEQAEIRLQKAGV